MSRASAYRNLARTAQNPPQSKSARVDQVENNAGGFVFAITNWDQLRRFLILGADSGTYYVGKQQHFEDNIECLRKCVEQDPQRVVDLAVEVSDKGLALSNNPAIFVLAYVSKRASKEGRTYANSKIGKICRISTHLFTFLNYVKALGDGSVSGMGTRKAIGRWYNEQDADRLAYQILKYRNREGWTHRDALRVAHPKPVTQAHEEIFEYVTSTEGYDRSRHTAYALPAAFEQFESLQAAKSPVEASRIILDTRAPREFVPTELLNDPTVWRALLPSMPIHALVRNLSTMTRNGVLDPWGKSDEAQIVKQKLADGEQIRRSRMHPFALLIALMTYQSGKGRSSSWQPLQWVSEALDKAYELAYHVAEPTGFRYFLGLDVSGSMGFPMNDSALTARDFSAAMATVINRLEEYVIAKTFSGGYYQPTTLGDFPMTKGDSVAKIIGQMTNVPFGGTDCALPILYATENKLEVDVFITITDNETWFGTTHPFKALQQYRKRINPGAKSIVIGTDATPFTIAYPKDPMSLDIVGADASLLDVISTFAKQ